MTLNHHHHPNNHNDHNHHHRIDYSKAIATTSAPTNHHHHRINNNNNNTQQGNEDDPTTITSFVDPIITTNTTDTSSLTTTTIISNNDAHLHKHHNNHNNNNNNNNHSNNNMNNYSKTLIQLPMESIVHCLSFLHSKDIFNSVIPVCQLFQRLSHTRQLWDSVFFCTLKNANVSPEVLDQFPIRHIIVNSKQFSIVNLIRMNSGLDALRSVILSSIVIDYRNFIYMMNVLTNMERLTLDRCKVINYFEPPMEDSLITNRFERLTVLECKGLQGDYETKLKILQIIVSRCKNVTSLTMSKNSPLLLQEMIYQKFHPEMQLESLSLEEEYLFAQNQETHVLDQFFQTHCNRRLKKLSLVNCRHRFDTMLSHCSHTLEYLIVVSGFWHHPFNELPYPTLPLLARLTMISCHIQVVERILSDCVSENILQIKLAGPSRNHQCNVFFRTPKLKSLKSNYALPFPTLAPIIMTCDKSLECLEFAFAKRTLLTFDHWHPVALSLSDSLVHLSMDNVRFDDQWWLLKLLRDLKRLETLRVETASSEASESEETCVIIPHDCLLRVLVLEDCDITAECFDRVLQYCGSQLFRFSCDFSYDKKGVVSEKMQSIALQCEEAYLTINCMDQVPARLELFSYDLPLVTINVRDLSLEDMVLLTIVCDKVKNLEFNKDQGAMNFPSESAEALVEQKIDYATIQETMAHVITNRVANLNQQERELLLTKYKSINLSSDVRSGNIKGLLRTLAIQNPDPTEDNKP